MNKDRSEPFTFALYYIINRVVKVFRRIQFRCNLCKRLIGLRLNELNVEQQSRNPRFKKYIEEFENGIFINDATIERLEASGDIVKRVVTNRGVYNADSYVLCLGSWSPLLVSSSLRIRLPIYPVKGYSITVPVENHHTPPSIGGLHEEDLLGFATMGDHFRISSVSEFTGYDLGHTPEDFEHIFKCAKKLFPNAGNYNKAKCWSGLRPMTPEATPI